ncbi:MAG: AMP-binding protein [Bacteroidales bacterium]|nr:MAG: AMP-binding protein [Bacteroidales bacterium]
MGKNFIPEIEKQPHAVIEKYQVGQLQKLLDYLLQHSGFYSSRLKQAGIQTSEIRSLGDLNLIPPTIKNDLQLNNEDFICVGKEKIIDYITTSGTLGDPVTLAMTDIDLNRLAYNEAISFACADGSPEDIYQLALTLDKRFMAGLAYFLGARMLGAGVVRVGGGIPELQWDTVQRISPTTIVVVPSFLLKLVEYAEQNHIDYRNSSIRKAVCIGEPIRNPDFTLGPIGTKIMEKWDLTLYSTYASTEMATAFTECGQGKGGHHHPELIIVEFLDEKDQPVGKDEPGEVTITTLGVEGMPLLRYKTGDICYHYCDPCPCGRQTIRLGPVIGRKNQMIKFKGTTLYPYALYNILDNIDAIDNYVVEVYTNNLGMDEILIRIGCDKIPQGFEKDIKDHFRARLRVAPSIRFESSDYVSKIQNPREGRKAVKFIDHRNNREGLTK